MSAFEQTIIQGNLGKDPELRYTQNGQTVCNFNVAVDRSFTNDGGQRVKRVAWYRVSAWGKQAESCYQFLKKGAPVLCVGTVDAHAYIDRDNQPVGSRELNARRVQFLGSASHDQTAMDPNLDSDHEEIPF